MVPGNRHPYRDLRGSLGITESGFESLSICKESASLLLPHWTARVRLNRTCILGASAVDHGAITASSAAATTRRSGESKMGEHMVYGFRATLRAECRISDNNTSCSIHLCSTAWYRGGECSRRTCILWVLQPPNKRRRVLSNHRCGS